MSLEEHLAVPYILEVECFRDEQGQWQRRAMYPELRLAAESPSVLDALDALDAARIKWIRDSWLAGRPIPMRRAPLRA